MKKKIIKEKPKIDDAICIDSKKYEKELFSPMKELFFKDENDSYVFEKFREAVNGPGSEINRIYIKRSSSLCAFLHFVNVAKKGNKVIISYEDDNGDKYNDEYKDVFFEVLNPVIDPKHPSSIDLVLVPYESDEPEESDESKPKKILFLESKFSEYFDVKQKLEVNKKYKEYYDCINNFDKYPYVKYDEKSKLYLVSKDKEYHYLDGIKQIISHYIGVCNFINNENIDQEKRINNASDYEVELRTILFNSNRWTSEEKNKFFNDYQMIYEELAKLLNDSKTKENFANKLGIDKAKLEKLTVNGKLLTYQDIFKKNSNNYNLLTNQTKAYYRYEELKED